MADGTVRNQVDLSAISSALGVTQRGTRKRADRENWLYSALAVSGGSRRLYALSALPADVQQAINRQRALQAARQPSAAYAEGARLARKLSIGEAIDGAVEQRQREQGLVAAAGLTGKNKQRMDAKLDLLQRLAAFAAERKVGICAVLEEFCAAYNAGDLPMPADLRQHIGEGLHPNTLRRWRKLVKTQGPAALAGAYGNRAGSSVLDTNTELRDFVIGLVADKPHISAKSVHRAVDARMGDSGQELPALRSLQRWLTQWKTTNAEAFLLATNPDAWKNKYMAAFGSRSEGITGACQLWELDSTPADLQLIDGRYCIVGAVDVAWRGLRLFVTKTSSAEAIGRLMRRCILDWGVPEAVKMDNGRDYASERNARLLASLEIEPRFSAKFSPWEKPHIERAFRTFSHCLVELLPGYSGHNVADAQAIRARESFADQLFTKNAVIDVKLTAAELQMYCDRWCRDWYEHDAHEGLDKLTPFEKRAQLRNVVRRIEDVRALDLLLGDGDMRTVRKKGIRSDKLWYIAPELAGVIGQQVLVRMDDDGDLGRVVVYHHERFLCIAECPEVLGISRREIAIESKALQAKKVQAARADLKAAKKKVSKFDALTAILDRGAEKHASLTTLPAPNVIHITPALEAAAAATQALDAERAPVTSLVTQAHLDNLRDALRDEQSQDETAEDRFRRAMRLLLKPESERDELERRFLRNHLQSPDFRGRWMLFEDFGPSAFGLDDEYNALLPDGAAHHHLQQAKETT